jgi:hypothetical protein
VDPTDDRVELLESTYSGRSNSYVVVLLIAVTAAVVGLVSRTVHSSPDGQHAVPLPSPNVSSAPVNPSAGPSTSKATQPLWVYFEPLDNCMSTDHYGRLRIALSVSNLNDKPSLQLQTVQLGARPCAERATRAPTKVPASGEVVAMNFAVGPGCPEQRGINVRLTFATGSARLHADTVVSLNAVKFLQCDSA